MVLSKARSMVEMVTTQDASAQHRYEKEVEIWSGDELKSKGTNRGLLHWLRCSREVYGQV
jgi:hypothetical protein